MTEMQYVQKDLKYGFDIKTEIDSSGTRLYGQNNFITVSVAGPHEGNDYNWLLRMSPTASFDRWANSMCVEHRSRTSVGILDYLDEYEADIYRDLFITLSEEYRELREEYESLSRDYDRVGKLAGERAEAFNKQFEDAYFK